MTPMRAFLQWLAIWLWCGAGGVGFFFLLVASEEDKSPGPHPYPWLWLMLGWPLLGILVVLPDLIARSKSKSAETTDAPPQPAQPARSSRDDSDFYTTKKQDDHQWYGEHHELNWRDREYGQAMGWDVDAYVNWLEQD